MSAQSEAINYLDSLGRALTYIEERLDSRLELGSIAESAGFSRFYFSRLFQATVGETVFEYVRKRRLAEIARALVESDTAVVELALRWGYDSQQSMTKAFRKRYRISPGRYRRAGVNRFFYDRPQLTEASLQALHADFDLHPTVVSLSPQRLIGVYATMPITTGEPVEATRRRFRALRREFGLDASGGKEIYEVTLMREEHRESFSQDSLFDGFIGVLVNPEVETPPSCSVFELPGSRYLCFSYTGDRSIAGLSTLYRYIFSTGLASRTEPLADRDFFHVYPVDGATVEIYLPLRH